MADIDACCGQLLRISQGFNVPVYVKFNTKLYVCSCDVCGKAAVGEDGKIALDNYNNGLGVSQCSELE